MIMPFATCPITGCMMLPSSLRLLLRGFGHRRGCGRRGPHILLEQVACLTHALLLCGGVLGGPREADAEPDDEQRPHEHADTGEHAAGDHVAVRGVIRFLVTVV